MVDFLVKRFVKNSGDVDDPAVRQRYGALSGGVGIALNLLLFAVKLLSGVLTASIAVMADAFNNLTDAASSVVTLIGFRLAGERADDDHPFGHGRMEYLSGFVVSLVILLVGLELLKSSAGKILHPEELRFSWISVGILAFAILVKLWMFFFNRSLSRRIGSTAMAATATDSLSDTVATSVVLAGTLVTRFTGVQVDGFLGILVALFILRSGIGAARDTMDPLLGKNPDPELVRAIQKDVLSHPEVLGIHDLVIHDYGPGRSMMSFHAEVSAREDVMAMHDAIDVIERELKARFHIETVIHMDPIADDADTLEHKQRVAELVAAIDPRLHIHDFRMTSGPLHTNLIFDVVAPHRFSLSDEELKKAVDRAVSEQLPGCYAVVQIDHGYTEAP